MRRKRKMGAAEKQRRRERRDARRRARIEQQGPARRQAEHRRRGLANSAPQLRRLPVVDETVLDQIITRGKRAGVGAALRRTFKGICPLDEEQRSAQLERGQKLEAAA